MVKENDGRRNNKPPKNPNPRKNKESKSHVYQFRLNPENENEALMIDVIERQKANGDTIRIFVGNLIQRYHNAGEPQLEIKRGEFAELRRVVEWIADQIESGGITQSKSKPKKQAKVQMPSAIADTLSRYMNMGISNGDSE